MALVALCKADISKLSTSEFHYTLSTIFEKKDIRKSKQKLKFTQRLSQVRAVSNLKFFPSFTHCCYFTRNSRLGLRRNVCSHWRGSGKFRISCKISQWSESLKKVRGRPKQVSCTPCAQCRTRKHSTRKKGQRKTMQQGGEFARSACWHDL